ncbi:MAG: bifunctional hydroxymethylpyrimidine kinase/phosphomethylpyrimidine kinase [Verrucomicrobiae bacterium]|nr:bifunctional hydroxymethylpyrimidine kinase/phosphomethylpyrimidine kinase [Verrucomicrobiae bacterium]
MRRPPNAPTSRPPTALTVAGSDCSGGAGIEADLKTFAAHGVYGMAAVTCVVAETPCRVVSIQPVRSEIVAEQTACCLGGLRDVAVKTGMLYSAAIIRAVARAIGAHRTAIRHLAVDPVMVATSGARLLREDAIRALQDFLAERADLVTPNLDEAAILDDGRRPESRAEMEAAAGRIAARYGCAVLMKGGHLRRTRSAPDFFTDGTNGFWMETRRIRGIATHGTGCTFSAAVTAHLALGRSLPVAVRCAKRFLTSAIRRSCRLGPWMALNHLQGTARRLDRP